VIIYTKSEWIGHIVIGIVIAGATAANVWVCLHYGLRVGPFAEENWDLFGYYFQKPFFKMNTWGMGITAAFFYMKILSFRRIHED